MDSVPRRNPAHHRQEPVRRGEAVVALLGGVDVVRAQPGEGMDERLEERDESHGYFTPVTPAMHATNAAIPVSS
jgi:hypothetical protein